MSTFGTRVLTDPVSQWFTNKPLSLVANEFQRVGPISVAADSTKDVKGAWVELIASTSSEANMVYLTPTDTQISGQNTAMLLDLGFGSSGSEVVVVENLPVGWLGGIASQGMPYALPLSVPPGTRISARVAAFIVSDTINIRLQLGFLPGFVGSNLIETFGATVTDSRGTNFPVADTYVEFVASTNKQYRAIIVAPTLGWPLSTLAAAGQDSDFVLGIGPSGSEVDVMTVETQTTAQESIFLHPRTRTMIYAPANPIAVGSRIAVKNVVRQVYRDAIIFGVV